MTVVPAKLAHADWLTSPALQHLFAALGDDARETRVIGGAVRNTLLGIAVSDMDLASELLPEEVIARATAAGLRVHPTGLDHGTVTVVSDGVPFEVTTLRRDVETDGRRAVVAFTRDWSEDAHRRDFTINALSVGRDGTVFDYTGGLDDLAARRVRFIGTAEHRIREDYLRILRFFRFNSAYAEGPPDAPGLAASAKLKDGLARLSAERIGAEMLIFVMTRRAGEIAGIMNEIGVLAAASGLEAQPQRLSRLQEIEFFLGEPADKMTRLAALFVGGEDDARTLAEHLRLSTADATALARAAAVGAQLHAGISAEALRQTIYRAGSDNARRALRLSWATSSAPVRDAAWADVCRRAEAWQPPAMPFSGADVLRLGVPAGPRVGRVLKAFEAWWIEQDFPENCSVLEQRLAALAAQS